ncbi:MAG: DUF6340 family protein [Bacteroidota bacterium]
MKTSQKIHTVLLFLGAAILTCSCSGIRDMQVQVMRPAVITVPGEIQKIALLNRSIPASQSAIEGTLTGEMPKQDKALSNECISALNATLLESARFEVKRLEYTMNAADPNSLSFGAPLDWKTVDTMCARLGVDGLLVLEYFDSDFTLDNAAGTTAQAVQSVLNGGQTSIEASGTATATCGFRVYYAKKQVIPYEDEFRFKKRWRERANTAAEAVGKLIKRNPALKEVSYETGIEFARSIVPLYIWEHRDMYKGKKGEMERAERQALAKDWEGALQTWMSAYDSATKNKVKAKAALNIALAYEVLGNLKEAQKWAGTAYVDGGKRAMLEYAEIIDQRVREQNRLEEQLKTFE